MRIRSARRSLSVCFVSLIVAASLVAVPGSAGAVTIVDLGPLPGHTGSYGLDINDAGTVVGGSRELNSRGHAVRWDNGVPTALSNLPGDLGSEASEINNRGQIIGTTDSGPVRWSSTGAITRLATLPGDETLGVTFGQSLNNAGTVVGHSTNLIPISPDEAHSEFHAVTWDATGRPTALPVPPGTVYSQAKAINDNGVIVGDVAVSGQSLHATRWNTDGTVTDLGTLPGGVSSTAYRVGDDGSVIGFAEKNGQLLTVRWSPAGVISTLSEQLGVQATDVNGRGTIVGSMPDRPGGLRSRAVRWPARGRVVDLGTLPGHDYSYATAINENGVVVGDSVLLDVRGTGRAVRWDPNGTVTNLGRLRGGTFSMATGINEKGVVFGFADTANGAYHAVLWR